MLETARSTDHLLGTAEFDVVWEHLGLGATPVVLRLPSPGRTHAERREIEAVCWSSLRGRGLAGPDHLDAGLADLLRALAAPAQRLELRSWLGRGVRALAAGHDGTGVLAVRHDDAVVLRTCESLTVALLSVLPPAPAGPGRAASAPTALLRAAAEESRRTGLRAALVTRGIAPTESGLLATMLRATGGQAQIVASAPDRWGTLRRHPDVLTLIDGPRGRYLLTRSSADDGAEWTTVAPADARRVHHRVAELLADAVAHAAT